jgi:hypothetical protein
MTLDEVAAIADPAGPAERDVSLSGKRAANLLSGCRRADMPAPANDSNEPDASENGEVSHDR